MAEDLSPIVRAFEVECTVEHAFDTWTRRIELWWPLSRHSVSRENAAAVAIEPRPGGRLFETTRGGEEILWGIVTAWEPPNRLAYLWFIGEQDASEATQVTITFAALAPDLTRVSIEHAGWDRAGPKGGARRRGNERGWQGLEAAFKRLIQGRE